ncbi:MAG: glycosyltransferase family 39 protein [Burkholderiales bacterium]|nr:glycosyltransferase family 39 protein [Burkholderiales bacterium]
MIPPAATARHGADERPARTSVWRRLPPVRVMMFFALVLALWFGFIELRGLYFPDEGRYAEIPREMLATGDWITPRLDGFPYFEKPPFQYWMTAAVFSLFGDDEWTARLAPAIAGFLAVLGVGFTAGRLYSRRAGWMAGAVLAASSGYFLANQFVTLDVTLTALLTGALCAFLLAQRDDASPVLLRRWMYAAWLLCGLAFLAKGAIAVVLPGLAILAYVATTRDWRLLTRLHAGSGVGLFALVVVPWLVAVETRNPGFLHFFFVTEHWERFLRPSHRRTGPWWYFVPIGIAFTMPWLPAMVDAGMRRGVRAPKRTTRFVPQMFAACWAGAVVIFFSLSSSKLPPYILPALAGVVLAVAPGLARTWQRTVRITGWTLVASGMVGAALAFPAARLIRIESLREAYAAHAHWVVSGMAVLAGAGICAVLLARRRRIAALACIVAGGMLGCQLAAVTAHRIDAYFSAEWLIEEISGGEARRPFQPAVPFYSVELLDQSVPFYLGRTVILVKEQGELAWGIARSPGNYVPDLETFAVRWRAENDAYAIMLLPTYAGLAAQGLPMHVLAQDGRRIVVTRR